MRKASSRAFGTELFFFLVGERFKGTQWEVEQYTQSTGLGTFVGEGGAWYPGGRECSTRRAIGQLGRSVKGREARQAAI